VLPKRLMQGQRSRHHFKTGCLGQGALGRVGTLGNQGTLHDKKQAQKHSAHQRGQEAAQDQLHKTEACSRRQSSPASNEAFAR